MEHDSGKPLANFKDRSLKVDGEDIIIESVREEKRLVMKGPDTSEPRPCLVVRLRRAGPDGKSMPGRHIWVQLQGIDPAGEEHLYYSEVGKYTAVFYDVTDAEKKSFSLNLVPLDAFKKQAESQNNAANILDLPAPAEGDTGPRRVLLQQPTTP